MVYLPICISKIDGNIDWRCSQQMERIEDEMHTIVSYDSRAVTISGTRTLILSGAIHYPRSTPEMWPKLMQYSRDMGLNTIETYVFWNLHERQYGIFDFTEQLDLLRFCQLAQDYGLYVILRIGPYICAETNYGGFPAWLRDIPDIEMRTFNQPFMQEMERWIRLVAGYTHSMFASQGGPIILFQLENEYNNIASHYKEDGQRYLQWVSDLASKLDIDIPSIMCLGAAPGTLETMNSFYGHQLIDAQKEHHPDQPALWTENWPGWYNIYGAPHRRRTSEDCAYGVARFIAAGGTGVNYYMWHGGTNFGRSAMYLQTTSYDFDAPLNEYGIPTTKAYHLARLHTILHEYATILVQQQHVEPQRLGKQQYAYVYTLQERELIFLCNDASHEVLIPFSNRSFSVPARSVSLLSQGQILFNTAQIEPKAIVQQQINPLTDAIEQIYWQAEPAPEQWPLSLHKHKTISDTPIEQLLLTHDNSDYCWYTTKLIISDRQNGVGILKLAGVADIVYVFMNGQLQAMSPLPLKEDRGPLDGPNFTQSFPLTLAEGTHTLSLLTCAIGLIKGDWMLGDTNMVREQKGFWGQAYWNEEMLSGPWTMQAGLVGEEQKLFEHDKTSSSWQVNWQEAINRPLIWWRLTFSKPQTDDPLVIDLSGMNKGIAWLNGHCIGRYWLVAGTNGMLSGWQQDAVELTQTGEPSQRYYYLPAIWLQEHNELILFEEQGGNPGQVCLTTMRYSKYSVS